MRFTAIISSERSFLSTVSAAQLIDQLQLEPHLEGGYYRRIYASDECVGTVAGQRPLMSSILYLLTADSPVGHLHCNRSDIVHFFLQGGRLEYTLFNAALPDAESGKLEKVTLGMGGCSGQNNHLVVPGGIWKASQLIEGEYALISEAVTPGFDYADMQLAQLEDFRRDHTAWFDTLRPLIKT